MIGQFALHALRQCDFLRLVRTTIPHSLLVFRDGISPAIQTFKPTARNQDVDI